MDHLFFVSCVSHVFMSVHCCIVVTYWDALTSWPLLVAFIEFLLPTLVVPLVRCVI